MAVAMPLAFGLMYATESRAQSSTQPTATKALAFEVASVKRNKSNEKVSFKFTPDGISSRNNTLMWLIQWAYGADDERMIAGAPSWMKAENYDIEAKVDGSDVAELGKFSREQRNLMLQALLEDRFKLKYHRETKELPAFALVIAKNGPKFSESKPDDPSKAPHSMKIRGIYQLSAQGISMTELLNMLSQESGRSVVDKTGLAGKYDFTLQWSRQEDRQTNTLASESSGPSTFTALQEQMGLKLNP
jgi:uncharacterized protein (TIGR03435 family)